MLLYTRQQLKGNIVSFYSLVRFDDKNNKLTLEKLEEECAKIDHFNAAHSPTIYPKTFSVIKTLPMQYKHEATMKLSQLQKKSELSVGIVLHQNQNVSQNKCIYILVGDNGSIKTYYILNPLWNKLTPVKRLINGYTAKQEVSLAMQSQFFSMLSKQQFDEKIMQTFTLKDEQATLIYQWQKEFFIQRHKLNLEGVLRICSKITVYAKLPYIKIKFKKSGDTCSFSVKPVVIKDKKNLVDIDRPDLSWLNGSSLDEYEKLGKKQQSITITMDGLSLNIVMSWGMTPMVIIHELTHYIVFMLPLLYKTNKGEHKLSLTTYTTLFSGHGVLYTSVYVHLLNRFMSLNKQDLHRSLTEYQIKYFDLDNLNIVEINNKITNYLSSI